MSTKDHFEIRHANLTYQFRSDLPKQVQGDSLIKKNGDEHENNSPSSMNVESEEKSSPSKLER